MTGNKYQMREDNEKMIRESWMNWNPRFRDPDDETLQKLRQSRDAYAGRTRGRYPARYAMRGLWGCMRTGEGSWS